MKNFLLSLVFVLLPVSFVEAGQTVEAYQVNVLAGRSSTPMRIDGIGEDARFESITALWGDGANLYVADSLAIRRIELSTSRVTTLSRTAATGLHRQYIDSGFSYDFTGLYGLWGDGNSLYATDIGSGRIQKIDLSTGGVQTVAQGFSLPWGLAARGTTLYAASSGSGRVMQADLTTGATSELAETGSGTPYDCHLGSGCIGYFVPGPRSAWSDGINLYLTGYSGTVKQLDLASGVQTLLPAVPFTIGPVTGVPGRLFVASTTGSDLGSVQLDTGEFTPIALPEVTDYVKAISALWSDGTSLYIAQGPYLHAQLIRKVDLATGDVTTVAGVEDIPDAANGIGQAARFHTLTGIWDDGQTLYVTDRDNYSVRRIDVSTGEVTQVAGIPGYSDLQDGTVSTAMFMAPAAVWGDGESLYVTDQHSIRTIDLSTGGVRTLAGGVRQGAVNGIGTEALFNSPRGIWGRNGYLYIADVGNRVYRQLDLATLEVTTLAGAFGVSGSDDGTFETARFQLLGAVWGLGAVLYVADFNAIRAISLEARTVRTLAILPSNAGISALWGRGNLLYASGYTASGAAITASLYRIAIDTGEVSDVLGGTTDSNPGLPISFVDARGISGSSTDLFIATGSDNQVLRLTPDALPALSKLEIPNPGYSSRTTSEASATVSVGQARISTTSGNVTPAGFAIFGLRQNGVLISEASVPAAPAIRTGRISASVEGVVNTGIAIANPNSAAATITFYFTDVAGRNYGQGSFTLAGGAQIARFLTEAPFSGSAPSDGTFTFASTIPIAAVALRSYANERSEFLMTTLPVVDLSRQFSMNPVIVAHFAAGGGWATELVLVNPSDGPISGSLQLFGATLGPFVPSTYTIAPRASQRVRFESSAGSSSTGAIRILPQAGVAPSAVCIFSFTMNGVRVTEASVPDVPTASSFHLYAEATNSPGAIRSGIAIANNSATAVDVNVEFTRAQGQLITSAVLHVEGMGHLSLFLDEIRNLITGSPTVSILGGTIVRISSPVPSISVIGLRGRYNERGDFLITTTPAIPEDTVPDTQPLYIPHIVNGGGYTTQFVLFGVTAQSVGTDLGVTIEYFDQAGAPLVLPTR